MKIPAHAPLDLLHRVAAGTLATHSRQPQGFPYPSILPFAPDERHQPTILISRLAEHTRNLEADPRAGFLVADAPDGDVLNAQRVTLLGTFERIEPAPAAVRRYLRYQPDAERYLALGDFSFWTLSLERIRYIGGFGTMGWLDGRDLDLLDPLPCDEETALLERFATHPRRRTEIELIGVDRYGADFRVTGARMRYTFKGSPAADSVALHTEFEAFLGSVLVG
ncbi:HugZ family protein [Paraburkholderia rhizosphaerae]|uniref:HugZ family pyridoxamine 5'-phosphate oxidase n=1 Tax=Paraburkholderia rhizosphaerae TaxID=480658 RepID=UPI00106508E1|nr:pyridoxamine 5'-phosphate oxidase family protein [Paraburkholderia rhizosphaerae]